jgi:large subunit ribosomal protein L25
MAVASVVLSAFDALPNLCLISLFTGATTMPDTYAVETRTVLGKKVAVLRRKGTIPANIYGRGIESVAVQMPWTQARSMLNAHGRNTLIEVKIDSESAARPVVVRDIGRDPVSGAVEHIDFFQVDLTRSIQANVPIHLVDEAPAVHTYGGVLVQSLESILVEALPNVMPEAIEVSVSIFTELEQSLAVSDITAPTGVTILTGGDVGVAQIARPRVESEVEAVLEGEVGDAEGAGDAGAEGETSEE